MNPVFQWAVNQWKGIIATLSIPALVIGYVMVSGWIDEDAQHKATVESHLGEISTTYKLDQMHDNHAEIEDLEEELDQVQNQLIDQISTISEQKVMIDLLMSNQGFTRRRLSDVEELQKVAIERDSLRALLKKKVKPHTVADL